MPERLNRIVLVAVTVAAVASGCGERMPAPSSEAYADAVTAFYTSIAAIEVGEDRRAEELLLRVVELAPDEPAAWANLGLLALRRNELVLALDRLEQARELAPNASRIHYLLGLVEATRGNSVQAIAHFERAREEDPRNIRAIYALSEQIEMYEGSDATEEVRALIDAILDIQPDNVAVLVERARLQAIGGEQAELQATLDRLDTFSDGWTAETLDQLDSVRAALATGEMDVTTTELTFFTNMLKRESVYRESLAAVQTQPGTPTELIGEFLALPAPPNETPPADDALSFFPEPLQTVGAEAYGVWVRTLSLDPSGPPTPVVAVDGARIVFADGRSSATPGSLSSAGVIATDFNYDFLVDVGLAGPEGFRLLRADSMNGIPAFVDVTGDIGLTQDVLHASYAAGWTADIDMEGDLDLVLARTEGPPVVLRNNGDGSFAVLDRFGDVDAARGFVWADLDADGDPDAVFVSADGSVHLYANHRSQGFAHQVLDVVARAAAAADLNKDGVVELVMVLGSGEIVRTQGALGSASAVRATIGSMDVGEDAKLFTADVDNNGDVDVIISSAGHTSVFLSHGGGTYVALGQGSAADVYALADLGDTGRLDLVGIGEDDRPIKLVNRGTRPYGSARIRPLAAQATGDQRINPFGLGGEVEIRSGLLYQKQPILDPIVHFGLGDREVVELARIVWPNGDIQAEFDVQPNETLQARQRLKGSCPWLFAYNGREMVFVTDFIWRSPLGLRINALETAGVMMTEDWVKVEDSELVPRDGVYDLRITAELWETHFFDHVSLMAVDHPKGTDIFVDERFAFPPPALSVQATSPPRTVARVTDDAGRDVSDLVAAEDERYLATFEIGQYQGLAEEHAIEIDLSNAPEAGPLRLLASGWIRPTDSSINVAIAQGAQAPPTGLRLDVPDGRGGWKTVYPNLGFPAGKYKTIVLDLTDIFPADRVVRLTTSMEIYWDAISWARGLPDTELRMRRISPSMADLRYRGYSAVVEPDRSHPEVPIYDSLASTAQVWQDLVGYYTRFGDVRELLSDVDDRYVIMNAGDELRFEFPALDAPQEGWERDFILVGDGWVKDGDYNTSYSETVLPLPAHDLPDYAGPLTPLEDDPVYRRHPDDWNTFHTRYVTNDALVRAAR